MTLQQEVDLLADIPLFARVDPVRLKLLAFTSERVHFQHGDWLCRQGEVGDAAYIIISGRVDISISDGLAVGPAPVVASLDAHSVVGEIALLCDIPRTASAQAVEATDALRIDKEQFLLLLDESPQMARALLAEMAHRLDMTTRRLAHCTRGC